MSRISPRANQTFNSLYPGIRTLMTQRGCTSNLKTFYDGSAVVDLVVFGSNTSVNLSVIISSILDDKNNIIGYRCADSERTKDCKTLAECIMFIRSLVVRTKNILMKV